MVARKDPTFVDALLSSALVSPETKTPFSTPPPATLGDLLGHRRQGGPGRGGGPGPRTAVELHQDECDDHDGDDED
jgi:hypothetical protein